MFYDNDEIQNRKISSSIVANKNLGQNFLYDEKITDKIVKNEKITDKIVIEIGPGLGLLTKSILKLNPRKLLLIEKDLRLIGILREKFSQLSSDKFSVIERDALKFEIKEFFPNEKVIIISNLPYNISVKLLTNWFNEINNIESMTLMFQKEVARRISAVPSNKSYGSLSVITQWLFKISHKFDLPPGAFNPAPKIYSSILNFVPYEEPLFPAKRENLERLSNIVFSKRRKMLKSILKNTLNEPDKIFTKLNIDGTKRPENLSVEEFCSLSAYI